MTPSYPIFSRAPRLSPAREAALMRDRDLFGLSVGSAWGNGHATLWRGLISALDAADNRVVFFERDVP